MAKFIESEYDRQQQEAEAKAQAEEQQRIQAEAEAERIAQAQLEAEAADDVLQPVEAPLPVTVTPDGTEQLALAASLSNVTGSLLAESREVEKLLAEVAELKATVIALVELLNEKGEDKAQAQRMLQNFQTLLNGQMDTSSTNNNGTQAAVRNLETEARAYREIIKEGVEDAAEVKKVRSGIFDYINSKFSEYVEAFVAPMVYAFMNTALRVIGIDRNQALMALNDMQLNNEPVLTKGEFNLLMATTNVNDVAVETDEAITKAATPDKPDFDEQVAKNKS